MQNKMIRVFDGIMFFIITIGMIFGMMGAEHPPVELYFSIMAYLFFKIILLEMKLNNTIVT